jgi:hypothetical protein
MSYRSKISILQDCIQIIDKNLANSMLPAEKRNALQEQRYRYSTEIRKFSRIQWEQDHEVVDISEER